jgi:hypothetical protein
MTWLRGFLIAAVIIAAIVIAVLNRKRLPKGEFGIVAFTVSVHLIAFCLVLLILSVGELVDFALWQLNAH